MAQHDPNAPPQPPLVPKTPGGTIATGGIVGALLASIGWLITELLELEKRVQRSTDITETTVEAVMDLENDLERAQERIFYIEQVLREVEVRP